MDDKDLHEELTKHQITYITDERGATTLVKKIDPPKCTEIFMTVIDGIHIYVHGSAVNIMYFSKPHKKLS